MAEQKSLTEFEDWQKGGELYARSIGQHVSIAVRFGNDLAWLYDGLSLPSKTEEYEEMYAEWLSGENPYSPHAIPLDGYDYDSPMVE